MPDLWEQGIPVVETNMPAVDNNISTPPIWNQAKPKTQTIKASWDNGVKVGESPSMLQRVYETTLGEGTMTGEFDKMTKLGQTLDLMGRPGYAVKSLINQTQQEIKQYLIDNGISENEVDNTLNPKRQELLLKFRPQVKERFKAMWRGLTGHERITANQLWDNIGVGGIPFLGFATEIALDPLMAFGGAGYKAINAGVKKGIITPTIKATSFGFKQAQKIPQVARATEYVVDGAGEITEALRQAFITKSKIPELAAKVDKYLSRRQWLGGQGLNLGIKIRDAVTKEAASSGKSTDDIQKMVVNLIEQPKKYTKLATKGEMQISRLVEDNLKRSYTQMTDAGVPISSLGAARKARIVELRIQLEGAVGKKKTELLGEIAGHKQAIEEEIIKFRGGLQPLEVDVAHYSKNPNITEWKVNKKTVRGDLGTDMGTERAALARQQDISRGGGEGKIYYPTISPRRSIDATKISMEEQLQYWDKPEEVVDFIYKTGAIGPDEYEKIKNAIPDPGDIKFKNTKTAPGKVITKLVAQPTGRSNEGLLDEIKTYLKRELTPGEMERLPEVLQGKSIDIDNIRISFNPKIDKYNIYTVKTTAPTTEAGTFVLKRFSDATDDWYVDFRQKLINKGYDSIKYFSLEDPDNPTYKILTGRIVGPASKKSVIQQEKLSSLITKKEADVINLVNEAKDIYNLPVSEKRIAGVARKLGVGRKEATELAKLQRAREMGYFPRFTTKEAEGYLRNASTSQGLGTRVWNPKIRNALRRKTSDFTLDEWNTFVKENGLESLGGNKINEYFMRDPAYASTLYQVRAAKAITSAEFIQDVAKTFGKDAKIALPSWQELPESIQKLYPASKGMKFDPEVIKEVTRVTEHYINPSLSHPIARVVDGIQNSWRKWTLAPFPKYHLRNMVGNLWNNYLADVDPENYAHAQALQLYRKYRGAGNVGEKVAVLELKKFNMSPEMAETIIASAEEHGVLGRGWFGADIELGIKQQLEKNFLAQPIRGKIKQVATGKLLINKGLATGATIENNARLAHFLDKLGKGSDSIEAALSVKKFLFDYGDLTSFEKDVMRRLFPFYTWTRKNIPLQLEQLYKQPQKFAPIAIPMRMRNEEDIVKLKYARPDLYERLPIELKRTLDTVTYLPLEGLIPAGDLAKLFRPQELLYELLTPYLRVPLELQMDKSMYFESEIQKYDNETQELWRGDLPVKLKYALTTILPQARLISEIDKIVKKQTNKIELTPDEQLFSQSLSSIYKVELKDLRRRALSSIQKKVEDLRNGAAVAHRQDRPDEVTRIKNTYKQVKEEMRAIKGH